MDCPALAAFHDATAGFDRSPARSESTPSIRNEALKSVEYSIRVADNRVWAGLENFETHTDLVDIEHG